MGLGLTGAIGISTALGMASSYLGGQAAKEDAEAGKDAARRRAEFIRKRNKMEQSIAIQKFELEVAMEEERIKHETEYDQADAKEFNPDLRGHIEAQISNVADELAYTAHDLDDGLQAGLIDHAADQLPLIANQRVVRTRDRAEVQPDFFEFPAKQLCVKML